MEWTVQQVLLFVFGLVVSCAVTCAVVYVMAYWIGIKRGTAERKRQEVKEPSRPAQYTFFDERVLIIDDGRTIKGEITPAGHQWLEAHIYGQSDAVGYLEGFLAGVEFEPVIHMGGIYNGWTCNIYKAMALQLFTRAVLRYGESIETGSGPLHEDISSEAAVPTIPETKPEGGSNE